MTIGKKVTSIGKAAFYGCTGITNVNYLGTFKDWCEIKFDYSSNPLSVTGGKAQLYFNGELVDFTNLNIPNGTTKIGSCTFYGLTNLISVTIPDSVTSIGGSAFYGCTNLQTVTLGKKVTSIGNCAFENCTGLQTVNWNSISCTEAGRYYAWGDYTVFKGCTQITTINIGEIVESIPEYAFYGCTSITKVNYLGTFKDWCEIEFHYSANPLYVPNYKNSGTAKLYVKENGEEKEVTGEVTIPVGTTKIGEYAFCGLNGITSVTIPDSVTSIGYEAFSGCTGITKVNYLGTLKGWCEIEFNYSANPLYVTDGKAELYCNGDLVDLINLNIPVGTTKIGNYAFYGLNGITSVTIPDSVTSIGEGAFSGCTGLKDIYYAGGETQWGNINKGGLWDQYYDSDYYKIDYRMHYNSTGPEAASNISALPSDQPVLIACDRLDIWVKQD